MKNILVIGTGGTIASARDAQGVIRLDNPFVVTEYEKRADVNFICLSPFSVLSENMSAELIIKLLGFIEKGRSGVDGVIVLHGSDTLAYTAAFIANKFAGDNIAVVASNKPLGEDGSNGVKNFRHALDYLLSDNAGVVASYDGIHAADALLSANELDEFIEIQAGAIPELEKPRSKNVVIINPYPGIDYSVYDTDKIGAVIHTMYHSATVPESAKAFSKKCRDKGIPFYFVTTKPKAEYETSENLDNVIFNTTPESLYSKLILI